MNGAGAPPSHQREAIATIGRVVSNRVMAIAELAAGNTAAAARLSAEAERLGASLSALTRARQQASTPR